MNTARILGLCVLLLLLSLAGASAAETRINISITETVDQNVTFAADFDLLEDQSYCEITGIINVTNPSGDVVNDINLTFTNTNNVTGNITNTGEGRSGSQIAGTAPGDDYVLHIPELRGSDYAVFNYTVDCLGSVSPPLDIETTYSNSETGITKKVLAGHPWTLNQSVSNQLAVAQDINNIVITMATQNVTWNTTTDGFNLTYLFPLASSDASNVTGNGTSNKTWTWTPNGGTLTPSEEVWIQFNMTAPYRVPTSNTYSALLETLAYNVDYLASNLTLTGVTAVADLEFSLDKRIVGPASDLNDTNVTWRVDSDIVVPLNISYNLTKISFWVTNTLNLTDTNVSPYGDANNELKYNETPGTEINLSQPWTLANKWEFNYSDASNNVTSRPPIVWMRPYFTILNSKGQIINSSLTQNGDDYYMKYIYVVNGYWLQIDKNITNIGEDQYKINVLVQNIGNAPTPQGLVVTVYDFVPAAFAPWNWTPIANIYDSNSTIVGGGFNGTAYRFSLPPRGGINASLDHVAGNNTWNVTYVVNGTGEYKLSELYIVGLDPRKVDGAGSHEGITIAGGLKSGSSEILYVGVVFFLVIINVINFVMTRRINDKLNRK